MSRHAPGTGRRLLLLVLLVPLTSACERAPRPLAVARAPAASPVSEPGAISYAASFYGDVGKVRFAGPDGQVLVRRGKTPFITGAQYNAWLGTYPVKITSEDPAAGRREALEQMVVFKMLAQKARESGYEGRLASENGGADEKSMVLTFIRDHVTNIGNVTESEVRSYEARHPDLIAQIDSSEVPGEIRDLAIRGSVRGEQLEEQVRIWAKEADIRYVDGG